jgi:hypothetical protein
MTNIPIDDRDDESEVYVETIELPTGPGTTAKASTEVFPNTHGPLRVITLGSNRHLPSDERRKAIEAEDEARIDAINNLTRTNQDIPEDMQVPITVESYGFRGVDPTTWINERKYVKEGELYYEVNTELGGLIKVTNPSVELVELFDMLASYNREHQSEDFIKLTDAELERLS